MNISCVGFEVLQQNILIEENQGDLGVFRMKEGITLDEVTVIKHKKSLTTKVDRIIYDVERDSMAKNSVARQILEKLPFVVLNLKTETITSDGRDDFELRLNGKKESFLSEANQYVARLLQGDKMKQVELITSPQGQYSDKTAVINIVTKGSLPDGIVGNIMIDFGKDFIKPNLGVTSKIGKLVYNVNYQPGYTYYSELTDKTKVINYRDDTIHRTESELITWSKDDSHELQLNASYDFSDNDLLTFTGQYTYYRERARQYRSDEELNYDQYVPAFRASYSFSTVKMSLRAEVSFEKTINDMQFSKKSKKVRKNFFNVTPSASAIFLLSRKSTVFNIIFSAFFPTRYLLFESFCRSF